MKVANVGTVPVYTVSGPSSQALPFLLSGKQKRKFREDSELSSKQEILQDFEFSGASSCVRVSEDGNWVMSTGTYPPQMRVHNLGQVSLSYKRHTTALNTKFVMVTRDYSKSIHLQEDRSLEFHTPMGLLDHVRLPRYGRDIVYDRRSAEVLIPAVGLGPDGYGEVFRFNCQIGRFQKSFQIDVGNDDGVERGLQGSIGVGSVNCAAIAEWSHGLMAFGTSIGTVECWDPRYRARAATLEIPGGEITALNFSRSGNSLATGSSTGIVRTYDIRQPNPIFTKDLGFGDPVKNLMHLTTMSEQNLILAADKRAIKMYDQESGNLWTHIEPEVDLNYVDYCPDSGMLLSANEGSQQHAWFIPALGPAPSWCSFLDRLIENMAEEETTATTSYSNHTFLTMAELKSLSLDHLIGKGNVLRPYMHGYFVDSRLYEEARLINKPTMYEDDRAKRIQEKLAKKRDETQIRGGKKKTKKAAQAEQVLDDRFAGFEGFGATVADDGAEPAPKVERRSQANGTTEGYSGYSASRSEQPAAHKSSDGLAMRMSSTSQRGSKKHSTIGERSKAEEAANAKKSTDTFGSVRSTGMVGGKEVTFVPESNNKKKRRGQEEEEEEEEVTKPAPRRNNKDRRNASGNAFRNFRK